MLKKHEEKFDPFISQHGNINSIRSTIKTIKDNKQEIWNKRNRQTEFKLLNLDPSITSADAHLNALPNKTSALLSKAKIVKIEHKERSYYMLYSIN